MAMSQLHSLKRLSKNDIVAHFSQKIGSSKTMADTDENPFGFSRELPRPVFNQHSILTHTKASHETVIVR
jgi:hypothetical protein